MKNLSPLQEERLKYQPKLPASLANGINNLLLQEGEKTHSVRDEEQIKELFKNTYGMPVISFEGSEVTQNAPVKNVGVILSGGQAPGGHNVIAGLYDALKKSNPNNKLYGFLGGPSGIIEGKYVEFNDEFINAYRNTGGFDIIGSGRTKLETEEQFKSSLEVCKKLNISAVVIIGGDDSNTNAALLAEWFVKNNTGIQVIGCPKTIDGDLKNEQIEISFGFDTATKTYAELIGNIQRDANSAKKYWHFIKIMGRSASHVALEAALQTQPNITLISEEVEHNQMSLESIIDYIADIIAKRAANGKNFGIAIVPEGLIEFIPEMKSMIANLNDIMATLEKDSTFVNAASAKEKFEIVEGKLDSTNAKVYNSLPALIKEQLLADRDPHGNVQVSRIETEKLLIAMLETKLAQWKKEGKYTGKFSTQSHFFGYEGRCAFPSNFDADYCYSLGFNAFALINFGLTGYLSSVKNLTKPASEWKAGGVPLTMMMNMEKRHGEMKPVIQKALVRLDGPVFAQLANNREDWAMNDRYLFPGAIQYFGPSSVCDITTRTLALEQNQKVLSKLYDDKKQYLINSDLNNLSQTDNNIKQCVENINSLEEKRKSADEKIGINNTNMSSYIEIAEKNKLSVKQSFCFQKERLAEMNHIIANKEKTNMELIKQGLCTVNKLINIIVSSATKSNQYNNSGKNTHDEVMNISSIVEEV